MSRPTKDRVICPGYIPVCFRAGADCSVCCTLLTVSWLLPCVSGNRSMWRVSPAMVFRIDVLEKNAVSAA